MPRDQNIVRPNVFEIERTGPHTFYIVVEQVSDGAGGLASWEFRWGGLDKHYGECTRQSVRKGAGTYGSLVKYSFGFYDDADATVPWVPPVGARTGFYALPFRSETDPETGEETRYTGPVHPEWNDPRVVTWDEWVDPEPPPPPDPVDDPESRQAVVRTERVELWRPFLWLPTPWGRFTLYIGRQLEEEAPDG